tara:strand:- start:768 stop:1364 length:597 start_codon:yes stop_codon:yes gene_type:complete
MKDQLSSMSLKQILGGRNLYLIGMMGSGKTLTGPCLAQNIDYGFVDSDEVIEKVAHQSIDEIFKKDGEKSFRDIETQVLKEIGKHYALVVSTGGGIVTRPENWGVLHQGIIIWIDPGRDRLWERLQADSSQRPLLLSEDPRAAFDTLNKKREPLYKEADLRISVEDESAEDVAQQIINRLPSIITSQGLQDELQTIEE